MLQNKFKEMRFGQKVDKTKNQLSKLKKAFFSLKKSTRNERTRSYWR